MSGTGRRSIVGDALTEIRELRTALERSTRRNNEPVAIVGMACRVPGANNPAQFWDLVRAGRDATRNIPAERWNRCLVLAEAGHLGDSVRNFREKRG